MNGEDEIRRKIWNVQMIIDEIKSFPQTYDTLLGSHFMNPTLQFMARKKMNRLNKDGLVMRTTIPGIRFNRYMFYTTPKLYHIIVEAGRMGSNVFVFFDYEELGKKEKKFYIKADECWKLDEPYWKKEQEPKIFFEGNILKWI